jgi:hypothetical protein
MELSIYKTINNKTCTIHLNDENGCILRICNIPKKIVYKPDGELREFIDIRL